MKAYLAVAALLPAILVGGWYWLSPIVALNAFHEAVAIGDAADIAEAVDFPALREQLRSELAGQVWFASRPSATGLVDAAAVNVAIAPLTTPAGMRNFVSEAGLFARPGSGKGNLDGWMIDRRGFSSFKAQFRSGTITGPQLVFRRDGFGWRLVGIYAMQEILAAESTATREGAQRLDVAMVAAVRAADYAAAAMDSVGAPTMTGAEAYSSDMLAEAQAAMDAAAEAAVAETAPDQPVESW